MSAPRGAAVAGIVFLWFIGVLRDRLGIFEDRFFATVFLDWGFAVFPVWVFLMSLHILVANLLVAAKVPPDK